MRTKFPVEEPAPDPILDDEIERAVAPYRGTVTAEMLEHYRERLRVALLFHPVGRRLLKRVRAVPVLQNSDVVAGREPNVVAWKPRCIKSLKH